MAARPARAGMRTLLVEPREEIGGDITLAWLNVLDLNRGPHGEPLTRGIFSELYRRLGQTFDIARARAVLDELVRAQPTLTVMVQTRLLAPVVRGGALAAVSLADDRTRTTVTVPAEQFIDASDDAALAAASGVPYTVGREDGAPDRRMQPATLIFRLGGVDYQAVVQYVNTVEKPLLGGGVRDRYVWGYGRIVRQYRPQHPRVAVFDLNLGWLSDGTVLVNALQVFDVDGTDPRAIQDARTQALAELPPLVSFLRANAPGFEQAFLMDAAPALYLRETRHIAGMYRMTADDILEGRDFWDRIALASYPIDLHPYRPGQMNPFRAMRRVYAIPFRILVPVGVDRLMVVGKTVSASYIAAGSLRVLPTGMAMGEAAGEAAALAIGSGTTPARIALDRAMVAHLQRRLRAAGAFLPSPHGLYAGAGLAGPTPETPRTNVRMLRTIRRKAR